MTFEEMTAAVVCEDDNGFTAATVVTRLGPLTASAATRDLALAALWQMLCDHGLATFPEEEMPAP